MEVDSVIDIEIKFGPIQGETNGIARWEQTNSSRKRSCPETTESFDEGVRKVEGTPERVNNESYTTSWYKKIDNRIRVREGNILNSKVQENDN